MSWLVIIWGVHFFVSKNLALYIDNLSRFICFVFVMVEEGLIPLAFPVEYSIVLFYQSLHSSSAFTVSLFLLIIMLFLFLRGPFLSQLLSQVCFRAVF